MAPLVVTLALGCVLGGCSSSPPLVRESRVIVEERPVVPDPGAIEFIWEPPLVDVIDVPPGLDPEGHYYRPAHQSIVEIRQGRWKYYRSPEAR